MDFVIKQILLEENTCRDTSYVVLIGEDKEKKSVKQSQDPFANSDIKKDIKCYYYKRKKYFKLKYKKLKAN